MGVFMTSMNKTGTDGMFYRFTSPPVTFLTRIDDMRRCEYIFYRGLYRTSYARVSRSTITDTELQIGQFVVPKNGAGVQDDSDNARYLRAWKEEIPEVHVSPFHSAAMFARSQGFV